MIDRKFALVGIVSASLFGLAACDVEKTQSGNIDLPKYEVTKTQEGEVTVPKYDVRGPDVEVRREERQVTIPDVDVDVKKRQETVTVPTIDVTTPSERDAQRQMGNR
ncbi:hypothetical protein JI739_00205 [Ramlibacter sp. AW1]|uniref:DUF2382 domain-containing protein n=1 Tax=Ramlibacter aurantiacus TaxID=2801330 RepID=A0A936ZQB0_9BURK|nr:hypothetical protein [Ramlibacter aurantiacus]MBL0418754.1 hypothetical protein [Ramlibacter aurantiacus]